MSSSDEGEAVPLFAASSVKPNRKRPRLARSQFTDKAIPQQRKTDQELTTASSSFAHLGLDSWLCATLVELELACPTPVQANLIPVLLANKARFVVASAPTGSGKTAAFALPILDRLARDPVGVFAIVLTPTRELAVQISEQFQALGAAVRARCAVVVGGLSMTSQQLALEQRPHVVVATPGRLSAHITGASPPHTNRARYLVLDEADRLLDPSLNFARDVSIVAAAMPSDRCVVCVSATKTGRECSTCVELGVVAKSTSPDFEWHSEAAASTVPSLQQHVVLVPAHAKHAYLAWFVRRWGPLRALEASRLRPEAGSRRLGGRGESSEGDSDRAGSIVVFVSTCEHCQLYAEMLLALGVPCVALHSHLTQGRRLAALAKFRVGTVSILVATDVAARGLDIPVVDVVLSLDVPREPDNYIHRVGRCARVGRFGRAYMFVTPHDALVLAAIERRVSVPIGLLEGTEAGGSVDESVALVLNRSTKARIEAEAKLTREGFYERLEHQQRHRRLRRPLREGGDQ